MSKWRSLYYLGKNTHDHGNFRATRRTPPSITETRKSARCFDVLTGVSVIYTPQYYSPSRATLLTVPVVQSIVLFDLVPFCQVSRFQRLLIIHIDLNLKCLKRCPAQELTIAIVKRDWYEQDNCWSVSLCRMSVSFSSLTKNCLQWLLRQTPRPIVSLRASFNAKETDFVRPSVAYKVNFQ